MGVRNQMSYAGTGWDMPWPPPVLRSPPHGAWLSVGAAFSVVSKSPRCQWSGAVPPTGLCLLSAVLTPSPSGAGEEGGKSTCTPLGDPLSSGGALSAWRVRARILLEVKVKVGPGL